MVAVCQIERGWLGMERHIRAQPQLPGAVVDQAAHATNVYAPIR